MVACRLSRRSRGKRNLRGLGFEIEDDLNTEQSRALWLEWRRRMSPLDAGMATLERIRSNTVEARLLNARGLPNFDVRFFLLNKAGETAGVALYGSVRREALDHDHASIASRCLTIA